MRKNELERRIEDLRGIAQMNCKHEVVFVQCQSIIEAKEQLERLEEK